jgi:hypothetical protein
LEFPDFFGGGGCAREKFNRLGIRKRSSEREFMFFGDHYQAIGAAANPVVGEGSVSDGMVEKIC